MTPQEMLTDLTKWKNETEALATGLYNMVNNLPTSQEWNIEKAGDETLRINGVLVMYCPLNNEYRLLNDAPKYGLVWFSNDAWKMAYYLMGYLKANDASM